VNGEALRQILAVHEAKHTAVLAFARGRRLAGRGRRQQENDQRDTENRPDVVHDTPSWR
jgi:hypothetical protein